MSTKTMLKTPPVWLESTLQKGAAKNVANNKSERGIAFLKQTFKTQALKEKSYTKKLTDK